MSPQARNEAKRLRRLKRKQDLGTSTTSNSIRSTGLTVVGGGTIAAIAIALGVNSISPNGLFASNQDGPAAPIDSSQSPTPSSIPSATPTTSPSATASTKPNYSNEQGSGASGSYSISITASPSYSASPSASPSYSASPSDSPTTSASPSASPSYSASPSASPTTSASPSQSPSSPGVVQGSYFAQGRYGAGYYSTAYDVAFSSPMFQAGSGYYYGTSGYAAAKESPQGHYSQGGWNGSGFYESGYYDLSGNYDFSGNTGSYDPSGYFDLSGNYFGSWDGSGITFQYGTGAYYGASGYSDPIYGLRGSYYASGIAGSGYYASVFTGNYGRVVYGNWTSVNIEVGIGTYYGISGTSQPINAPSGSYYITGFSGAGYYSTGYYACGYGYVTGATEYNVYYGNIGRQTYYGLTRTSVPVAGPEGVYKRDGFRGTGYYEPADLFDSEYRFGTGSYYGASGYGSPLAPPTGMHWYYSGWGGTGFYSTGQMGSYWHEGIGTGTYYGSSGSSSGQAPQSRSGSYYSSGWTGAGYYASSYCPPMMMMGSYCYGTQGSGSYYGTSGFGTPQAGPVGSYYSSGWNGSGYYASSYCPPMMMMGSYCYGTQGSGSYYGTNGQGTPQAGPVGSYYSSGWNGSGYYASSYCPPMMMMGSYCYGTQGSGSYYGTNGQGTPQAGPAGAYYSSGWNGSGYYASGIYDMMYGSRGSGSYYGTNGFGTPQAGPQGSYYSTGYALAGYYSTGNNAWIQVNGGTYNSVYAGGGIYYGVSGYGSPYTQGPTGVYALYGYAGTGYYATNYYTQIHIDNVLSYGYVGGGTYYGVSGEVTRAAPPGSFYFAGLNGSGYYSSGYTNWETSTGQYINGGWARGYIGQGTYYGVTGASTPVTP